jgi:hypothetical protein
MQSKSLYVLKLETIVKLTPHSRIILEKMKVAQLIKEFLAFYGN